jgi:hypothetical protein
MLLTTLRESEFTWVADEVEAEVATGRLASVRLPAASGIQERIRAPDMEPIDFPLPTPPRQRAEFVRSEEYTPRERLLLVVEAARRASVAIADIHREAIRVTQEILGVELILVGDGDADNDLVLRPGQISQDTVDRLGSLLNELRQEASN